MICFPHIFEYLMAAYSISPITGFGSRGADSMGYHRIMEELWN